MGEIKELLFQIDGYVDNIIQNEKQGKLSEQHFLELWCNGLVRLVGYYIGYIIENSNDYNRYNRDSAVIYGILKELSDKLLLITEMTCKKCLYMNMLFPINRMYIENIICLMYLAKNYNSNELEQYRLRGLKHNIEYADTIKKNAAVRGYMTDWENNLLKSIKDEYDKVKTTETEVRKVKHKTIKDMFMDVNEQGVYGIAYKTLSTSVHGGWEYLSKNLLEYDSNSDTFSLKTYSRKEADFRLLNPLLIYTIIAIKHFLKYMPNHGIDANICSDLEKVYDLICDIDIMHFNFINGNPLLKNTQWKV